LPRNLEDSGFNAGSPQRIDLILTKGDGIAPKKHRADRPAPINGLWSSDHAGVVGSFVLLP